MSFWGPIQPLTGSTFDDSFCDDLFQPSRLNGLNFGLDHMCHGQARRVFLGMGDLPPLMTESL